MIVPGARTWWGIAAVAVYLTVALAASPDGHPALLFDGLAPPPRYNWVQPPRSLARGNLTPTAERGTLSLVAVTTPGSQSGSFSTPDGQATLLLAQGAFPSLSGETVVIVTLTPLDPGTFGAPPAALRYDGNAYRIEAVFPISRKRATLRKPATVYLRYATGATTLLHLAGGTWRAVEMEHYPGSNAMSAEVSSLGVFVTAAPESLPYVRSTPWWSYALLAVVLLPPIVALVWLWHATGRKLLRR